MKPFLLLVIIITLSCCSSQFAKEGDVIILNDKNFDTALLKYDKLLVKFYAPWCSHCQNMASSYSKAATVLEREGIILANLDCTVNKKIADKYKIEEYPTIKLFINNTIKKYEGGRTDKEIISWMKKTTGILTTTVLTEEEITKFIDTKVAVVYFGDNADDIQEFQAAARTAVEFPFAICPDRTLQSKFMASVGTVVLFKTYDEKRNYSAWPISSQAVLEFIDKYSTPKLGGFDDEAAKLVFEMNKPGLFLYRDKESDKDEEYLSGMKRVSDKIDRKLIVIVTDIKDSLEVRLADFIGIRAEELPCVRIHDPRAGFKKYNMLGEINETNIGAFVRDWEDGNLKATLKSSEIPTLQTGPVKNIVGKTFYKEVIENDKDVLVKFNSHLCGDCKEIAPIYEELAARLVNNTNVIIAEIDAKSNEVEGFSDGDFPSIKLFPGNKKEQTPIDYTGSLDLQSLVKFLIENCSNKVEIIKDDL